jgi:hypothetical protein
MYGRDLVDSVLWASVKSQVSATSDESESRVSRDALAASEQQSEFGSPSEPMTQWKWAALRAIEVLARRIIYVERSEGASKNTALFTHS